MTGRGNLAGTINTSAGRETRPKETGMDIAALAVSVIALIMSCVSLYFTRREFLRAQAEERRDA